MSRPNPAEALNGVQTGHICDRCNRRIQHGDRAGMYVTWYDKGDGHHAERGVSTVAQCLSIHVLKGQMKPYYWAYSFRVDWCPLRSETEALRPNDNRSEK